MCDGSRFCPCLLSHQGSHHVCPGRYSLFKWAGTLTFAAFRVLGDILAVLCICLLFQLRLPLRFISLCIIQTLLNHLCRFCGAAALCQPCWPIHIGWGLPPVGPGIVRRATAGASAMGLGRYRIGTSYVCISVTVRRIRFEFEFKFLNVCVRVFM